MNDKEINKALDEEFIRYRKAFPKDHDIPPLAQTQEPWCMKMSGCKTKCEDCPDEPPQRTEQEPVAWYYSGGSPDQCTTNKAYAEMEPAWIPLYTTPPQRTWVGLTDEELRTEFGKLYPNDIGILELAENNRDFAVEAIGARHHWAAFQAGARAAEDKLKEKNT